MILGGGWEGRVDLLGAVAGWVGTGLKGWAKVICKRDVLALAGCRWVRCGGWAGWVTKVEPLGHVGQQGREVLELGWLGWVLVRKVGLYLESMGGCWVWAGGFVGCQSAGVWRLSTRAVLADWLVLRQRARGDVAEPGLREEDDAASAGPAAAQRRHQQEEHQHQRGQAVDHCVHVGGHGDGVRAVTMVVPAMRVMGRADGTRAPKVPGANSQ